MSMTTDTGPFALVPTWVVNHPDLGQRSKLLYMVLATFADADGACFPSIATLAERMGAGEDTVRRAIRELEAADALTTSPHHRPNGSQTSNRYMLHRAIPGGVPEMPPPLPLECEGAPPQDATPVTRTSRTKELHTREGDEDRAFEEWWSLYPRKLAKVAARKAWKKVKAPGPVLEGTRGWVAYWERERTEDRFIPYPATFLNQQRWEETPAVSTTEQSSDGMVFRDGQWYQAGVG